MIIGAWNPEDGVEMIQKKNTAQLISLNKCEICPALPPGLYLKGLQLAIVRDEHNRPTMRNILKKYLARWYIP